MNDSKARLEKKKLEDKNRYFASKKTAILIYAPGWIAIMGGVMSIAMGLEETHYLIMGSLLALVCGSIGLCRDKIIQQEKAIQLLQDELEELRGANK